MANPILYNGQASPQSIYEEFLVTKADGNVSPPFSAHPGINSHLVGTRGFLPDGRVFYYTSNSSVALTAGSLVVVPATTGLTRSSTHDKIILTDSSANLATGVKKFVLQESDVDTNDIIENEYAEGYLWFENAAGQGGHVYKIRAHDGFDASGTATTKQIELYDPFVGGAAATDEISFAKNKHSRVITSTTAEEEAPVGVAPIAVTASTALATDVTTAAASTSTYFFWAQTWGPCAVEVDDTTVASGIAVVSGDTADRVEAAALAEAAPNTGFDQLQMGVGLVSAVAAAGDFALVDLRIAP